MPAPATIITLNPYALVSMAEMGQACKANYDPNTAGAADEALRLTVNAATAEVERFCDRRFVTHGDVAEFVSLPSYDPELYLLDYPLISITGAWESPTRVYDDSTKLTEGADYIVAVKETSKLVRMTSLFAGRRSWLPGWRTQKIVYRAGFATVADVPWDVKNIALQYGALIYRDVTKQIQGIFGATDAAGNFQRWGAPKLTDDMKASLRAQKRPDAFGSSRHEQEAVPVSP